MTLKSSAESVIHLLSGDSLGKLHLAILHCSEYLSQGFLCLDVSHILSELWSDQGSGKNHVRTISNLT